jgi:type III restriction enzyme
VRSTHEGYFSIDKKTKHRRRARRPASRRPVGRRRAYDLILKDKEAAVVRGARAIHLVPLGAPRGLGQPERLRDGHAQEERQHHHTAAGDRPWLRLSVDQHGERMDNPVTVHDINELTVVTDESYTDFVTALQKEIIESLSARPRKASVDYFVGKIVGRRREGLEHRRRPALTDQERLHRRRQAWSPGVQGPVPRDCHRPGGLNQSSTSSGRSSTLCTSTPKPTDGRKPKKIPLNEANFNKREFQELWAHQPQGRLPGRLRLGRN